MELFLLFTHTPTGIRTDSANKDRSTDSKPCCPTFSLAMRKSWGFPSSKAFACSRFSKKKEAESFVQNIQHPAQNEGALRVCVRGRETTWYSSSTSITSSFWPTTQKDCRISLPQRTAGCPWWGWGGEREGERRESGAIMQRRSLCGCIHLGEKVAEYFMYNPVRIPWLWCVGGLWGLLWGIPFGQLRGGRFWWEEKPSVNGHLNCVSLLAKKGFKLIDANKQLGESFFYCVYGNYCWKFDIENINTFKKISFFFKISQATLCRTKNLAIIKLLTFSKRTAR